SSRRRHTRSKRDWSSDVCSSDLKFPSISKKVPCLAVFPTFSISPVRIHFWHVAIRLLGGISCPVKYGFNGAIPELMSNKLLSLCGTSEKLFMARCPLLSKNSKNIFLSWFTPYGCIALILLFRSKKPVL